MGVVKASLGLSSCEHAPELEALLRCCLSRDPPQRPPAQEVAAALERCVDTHARTPRHLPKDEVPFASLVSKNRLLYPFWVSWHKLVDMHALECHAMPCHPQLQQLCNACRCLDQQLAYGDKPSGPSATLALHTSPNGRSHATVGTGRDPAFGAPPLLPPWRPIVWCPGTVPDVAQCHVTNGPQVPPSARWGDSCAWPSREILCRLGSNTPQQLHLTDPTQEFKRIRWMLRISPTSSCCGLCVRLHCGIS